MSDPVVTRRLLASLREIVAPVIEEAGLQLVAIELTSGLGGTGPVLRVSVDKPGGATISDCTRVSRQLSPKLDEADPVAHAYTLEVSTPGIDRPVQSEADFVRFTGCTARIKLYGTDGRRRVTGVLSGVHEGRLSFQVGPETRLVPLTEIERCNLVLDLAQYARLGEGLHPIEQEGTP